MKIEKAKELIDEYWNKDGFRKFSTREMLGTKEFLFWLYQNGYKIIPQKGEKEMTDPRAGKTYYLGWDKWREFCLEQQENPYKQTELSFDLGGGNYYTIALSGKKGEKDEL